MSQAASSPPPLGFGSLASEFGEWMSRAGAWVRREPLAAVVTAALFATLIYFFGFYRVFQNGAESTAVWTMKAWNSENDLEHGGVILPAALFIVWWHRRELAAAPKETSILGLVLAIAGALLFVFSVRTLQGRVAIFSVPLLVYGSVRYLWGRATARIILFPCVFLLFMVPLGFLVSRTVGLQNLAASVAAHLSSIIGVKVIADGDYLRALDGSFNFEVSGGCSGIRSLTAMTMLAALYVHFTQDALWKKGVIFASSLFCALLGNFARIFSVVLFAKFINVEIAGTLYHDWSGFVFFPIAVGGMIFFSNLVNRDWENVIREQLKPDSAGPRPPAPASVSPASAQPARLAGQKTAPAPVKTGGPISYDY